MGAGTEVAELLRERCLSMGGRRRKSSASVLGADGVLEASETLRSSFALRHHDQMQANAVSQRAAWVLVPRPLNCRVSDAVSARVAPRNGGACVSGADGVHEASETLRSSFALRHHDQMQANAVSQRAAWVLVLRSLIYSREQCLSMGGRRRKSSASVSAADGVLAAYGTLSRSLLVYHRDQMQANAVSQRAA